MPVYHDSFGLRGLQIAGLWDASDKYLWEFYDQIIKTKDVNREKAIAMSQYFDLQVFKKWDDQRSSMDKHLELMDAAKSELPFTPLKCAKAAKYLHAEEYQSPDFNQMITTIIRLLLPA